MGWCSQKQKNPTSVTEDCELILNLQVSPKRFFASDGRYISCILYTNQFQMIWGRAISCQQCTIFSL